MCPPLPLGSRRKLIQFVQDRPGHDRRYAIDANKIKSQLGWRAMFDFPAGQENTVRWYRDNADWLAVTKQRYDRQRLGAGKS